MKDLLPLIERLEDVRVVVLGDVMLDTYVWGNVSRISPEAPVPVFEVVERTHQPGGAANAAAGIAALGGSVEVGGVVGADPAADTLRGTLATCGVSGDGVIVDSERPTTTKTRFIATNQQVVRVDEEGRVPLRENTASELLEWARRRLTDAHAALLSDYGKGTVTPGVAGAFVAAAREAGIPVVVDPKGTDFAKYAGATVVTPNVREAREASRVRDADDAAFDEVAADLRDSLDGAALLVTRGAAGMRLYREAHPADDIPALAREVYDVTGAGDTVTATLAAALGRGVELADAVRLAAAAAAAAVGHIGAARVTPDELRRSLGSGV
jgi:D-beta-D-heptose 7-phosphate kinase/D-beta-D-heptose 1-phosphate adenosyltransferase